MHEPILGTRHEHWPDEAACAARAHAMAHALQRDASLRDACIELDGPLGAGKTTFVRHLLRGLGIEGRIKSPSYAVLEPHEWRNEHGAAQSAWHFDFYRFGDPREWLDAGFRETFAGPGLKLVEWAQNAGPQRPQPDLLLAIEPGADDSRRVVHSALTPRGLALLEAGCRPLML
ncbi:tRNA (adenosine(37)-N6)-threonylcarbamoyltransferase complex ATPase subunit type 1 TsaE [Rivibacter subsaxonicus]|uniref:tRNA threonylcarbamoyladenosine biosynthesis protein TsaE n=1 Tax=Rivibacter subsaxonicus TaxID=457575 RepID=A0A4Q7V780_9BURK|nr:tRNA (adenosine(37)-N6)-threonylcarbamoyltransferase complex ATPase subunit type 1 TsaE [Rivibacter subsaxonicus]RZT92486.1 tRNA threonylcarbamoyladenosine biosynthesis protein TsaE [Rivibacter subsaxonicus]